MVAGYNGNRNDRRRASVPEREPVARALLDCDKRQARHQGQREAQHRLPRLSRPVPRGRRREASHCSRLTEGL